MIPNKLFQIPESCAKVNNFWEYYNYIKGNNILLKKQTNELCRENKKLKCKLQIYFSDSGMLIYLITLLFYYFLLLFIKKI